MLKVQDTPNHLGAYISGTYEDLDMLHEAVFDVMGSEESYPNGHDALRTRIAGILYDIRHASMGDREIELVDNGVNPDYLGADGKQLPKANVVFSVPILWPELSFFALFTDDMAMSVTKRDGLKKICKNLPKEAFECIQDRVEASIGLVKFFDALVWQEMRRVTGRRRVKSIDKNNLFGWNTSFTGNCSSVLEHQYIDELNLRYINMAPEKRPVELGKIARYICNPFSDRKHGALSRKLSEIAYEYDVNEAEIDLYSEAYPEEFDW